MANTEFEGKSLDVVVWTASQELDIPIEKLRYKVLSKGKRGRGGDPGEPTRILVLLGEEPAPPAAKEAEPAVEATVAQEKVRESEASEKEAAPESKPAERKKAPEVEVDAEAPAGSEDDLEEDLDEPPPAGGTPMDDDDPIALAREARMARSSSAAVEHDDDGHDDEEHDDEGRDDDEDHEVGDDHRDRDDRVEAADEPEQASAEDEHRPEPEATRGGDAPGRDERRARSGRDSRRSRSRREARPPGRPDTALDPDDLEAGQERAREILPALLRAMGFELRMEAEIQEDHVYVPLEGEDCKYLLEHRAEGLNALQFLVNKMVYRGGPTRILVDADGYRRERQEELVERARDLADEVRDGGRARSLGSLNPFERRLVHIALREDGDVRTVSKGEGFLKRMEIVPKDGGDSHSRRSERPRRGRDRY